MNSPFIVIDLAPHETECYVCGCRIPMPSAGPNYGIAVYEDQIVPDDHEGEWGGVPVCKECFGTVRELQALAKSLMIPLSDVRPNMNRKGDWILTFTGVEFYPLAPRSQDIRIEDIAHALSMQCRYAGHVSRFYSVAEHSIRVSDLCPAKWKLWGLLHDASEAYLIDLPRPIKRYSVIGTQYREAENALMLAICERFGLPWPAPEPVERADKAMVWIESRDLMPPHPHWEQWRAFATERERRRRINRTLRPKRAEMTFLRVYRDLSGVRARTPGPKSGQVPQVTVANRRERQVTAGNCGPGCAND